MLSDRQCQLITAFLDGELDRSERKMALHLLRRSGEARALLQRLQEDSHSLQLLPQRKLAPEFPYQMLNAIRERGLQPTRPETLPFPPRTIPTWLGVAVAAAVLVLVSTGSYLLYDALNPPTHPVNDLAERSTPPDKPEVPPKVGPLNPLIPKKAQGVIAEFVRPLEVKLALHDLGKPKAKKQLTEGLKRDISVQFILPLPDTAQVVKRLEAGLNKRDVGVTIDDSVRWFKNHQPKQAFILVLYTENLEPEEVASLLVDLGYDKNVNPNPGDKGGKVVLAPMSITQRTEISKLIGVPVEQLGPQETHARIDLPMAVAVEKPHEKIGQGGAKIKRPPRNNRYAWVLAISPNANGHPRASQAIRDHLSKRRANREVNLQVVMMVNQQL